VIQKASRPSGENHLISDHSLSADTLHTLVVIFKMTKTARQIGAGSRVINIILRFATYLLKSESVRQGMEIFMTLARLSVGNRRFKLHKKIKIHRLQWKSA
jgi:hypothetical protein